MGYECCANSVLLICCTVCIDLVYSGMQTVLISTTFEETNQPQPRGSWLGRLRALRLVLWLPCARCQLACWPRPHPFHREGNRAWGWGLCPDPAWARAHLASWTQAQPAAVAK